MEYMLPSVGKKWQKMIVFLFVFSPVGLFILFALDLVLCLFQAGDR
jgi:hypothetical protein